MPGEGGKWYYLVLQVGIGTEKQSHITSKNTFIWQLSRQYDKTNWNQRSMIDCTYF